MPVGDACVHFRMTLSKPHVCVHRQQQQQPPLNQTA